MNMASSQDDAVVDKLEIAEKAKDGGHANSRVLPITSLIEQSVETTPTLVASKHDDATVSTKEKLDSTEQELRSTEGDSEGLRNDTSNFEYEKGRGNASAKEYHSLGQEFEQ